MNKIHNVIWSTAQNAWVVVAEGTKRSSKSGAKALSVMIALIVLSPAGASAATLPQGGVISVGEGSIVNNGGNQLVIKQTTDKLGVNWQSFNVGPDGQVIFDQPGKHSVAMNRVVGSDGSAILGRIDANGQVILVNPNGVIFGKDAQVNVGGIVASTLDITDEDFKNGNYKFKAGTTNGEVINQGTLQAAEGGYVALLGKSVKNTGVIKAKLGTAALAAGNAVTLDFAGDGLLKVQVDKSAVNALADNKGLIQADGGNVLMTARASNALLNTVVNNDGIIQAQTIENRAGKIFLDGGTDSGTVNVAGTLDASAPVKGNGGFIETSGPNVKIADGAKITTIAKEGKTGEWLVDPTDFYVVSGSGSAVSGIGSTTLQDNLALTNVTLQTSAAGSEVGDINVNADVTWSANTKLTLIAHNKVNINANITATGANAGLAITAPGGYNISPFGGRIRLPGANSTFSFNGNNYTMIRTVADLALLSATADNQRYAIADDIDASATAAWNSGAGYIPPGGWDRGIVNGLTLDGFNNSITNLRINLANDYSGLIGYASNASIGNLSLNANVDGFGYTGMIAGNLKTSTVYNVRTSGTVNGTNADDVGGIVGYGNALTLNNVTNYATVTGTNNVGGLVGYATASTIIYSYNLGWSVTGNAADSDYTGGLVGYAQTSTINHALSIANIYGANWSGGLIGYSKTNTISDTFATGVTYGVQYTGGLIGQAVNGSLALSYATGDVNGQTLTGGLIGKSGNVTINNVYSTGNVTGTTYTGGLVGDLSTGTINQAFSLSKVSGTNYVGGFAGRDVSGGVTNAYASGDVTGTQYVGGFFGSVASSTVKFTYSLGKVVATANYGGYSGFGASNTITESFWDTQSSGQATSVHGLGKTTAQMRAASTYANWNISSLGGTGEIWRIYDGFTGPLMRFVLATANVSANDKTLTYSAHAVTTAELNAGTPYGYSTGAVPSSPVGLYGNTSRADLDLQYILGGNTYGGGLAIRNAGTYTADKFYSTQFGYDIIETAPKTITVNKANLTVSAAGTNKTYDGTTNAGATFSDNRLGSDSLVIGSGSNTFSDKNAGNGKSITVNGITVTGADAGNYIWNTSTTTTADIAKANLTVTASGVNKTYDGTTSASANLSDNRIGSDVLVLSATGKNFADKNAGLGKTISVTGINVTGADAGNYTWNTSAVTSADIAKAALAVTAAGVNKTYDGTTNAGATLSDNRFGADDLIISSTGKAFSDKNAGIGKTVTVSGITVTGADAGNYTWNTSAVTTADIAKAALTVTATGVNKTYDGTTTAGSSLSDNRIGSDVLVLSSAGSTFADKNAGVGKTVTVNGISVSGADAANYSWNTTAFTTADIAKAALNVTASGVNKTYDGTTGASANLGDNRIGADLLTITAGSKTFSDKNAGTGKTITVSGINVAGADAGNYTWNTTALTSADIAKAALNVTATGINKTYDGSTTAGATLGDNRFGADDLVISVAGKTFSDKNAGIGKTLTVSGITVTGADAGNYTWNTSATTSADIAKAALNVTASGVNKTYDGNTNASVILADDRIGSDVLVLTAAGKSFADKNAGTGKTITVGGINVTGTDAGNYTWNTSASTTADIAKAALNITASGINKTYDGTIGAAANLGDDRIGADDLTLSATGKAFADKNAGTGKSITVSGITVTGADAGNYTWNTTALTTADITKAALNITASGIGKTYDGTTNAGATLSDNRIGADDLVLSAASKAFSDKNAGVGKSITVGGITVTGADAANYTWNTSAVTTADIAKAALTVSASGVNKTYDGSTNAGVNLSDNRIGLDDLVLSASGKAFSDKNAGTGKTVSVSGINVTGADAGNYTWNTTAVTSADIAKAALNVTATGVNKTYDGSTSAGATLGDDRIGSDSLVVSAASKNFADKNAGLGKTITIGGITVTGADAGNYTWNTTAATTADIAKAALNVTASGSNKTYDGSTAANVTFGDDRIGADLLVVNAASKAFSDKNAGIGKAISVSGITVTGADAANYTWNTSAVTSADIAKAALTVSATGVNKTYDGSTNAGATLSDNRFGLDDLLLSSTSKAFSDKNAGTGKAITVSGISVSGADAGNYTWNTTAFTSADIAKAALNVTATGAGKTYDGSTWAGATLADNRISGDNLLISAASQNFADKNAGLGKTINVNGITVTGVDAGNYTWNTSAVTSADIAKAALNVTANGINKTYDGTASAGVSFTDNRVGADLLTVNAGSKAFTDKNAGTGKAILVSGITVSGADAGNYTWSTSAITSADIAKAALSVTASGTNKTYDGTTTAGISLSDNRIGGDNLVVTAASQAFSDKNAGNGKVITVGGINVTGVDANNYDWNTSATTTANIAKAILSVGATGSNKTYDGSTSAGVSFTDNRIAGDSLAVGGTGAFVDKNAATGKLINVTGINVTGVDAGNYSWNTSTSAIANIAKAVLNVSAVGNNKTYDGTDTAGVSFSDDRIGTDNLVIGAAHSVFSDKNAGLGKSISVNGITVSGADAGNYTWNASTSTIADIAKASLVIKAQNGTKVEGDKDGQLKWSLQGGTLFAGDSIQGSLGRDAGESVGAYGINQGDLMASSNYDLSVVPGTFTITSAQKPPVVVPPVVVPPVVEPSKPVVNVDLEQTKEIISTISVGTKVASTAAKPATVAQAETSGLLGDYRLINLGMKLPTDDLASDSKGD